MADLRHRLAALDRRVLTNLHRGIEKESLRIGGEGTLADTPHPLALGSPLTNALITTDFSESQLELITGVHADVDACLTELTEIHQFVHRNLGGEALWCSSMPCRLPSDDDIPIARYGNSNLGTLKAVYRVGLANRYGRRLQTICGVHYNFSLPEAAWSMLRQAEGSRARIASYRTAAYFSLMRNFRRHAWLPVYLFGASPAADRSFVAGRAHDLKELEPGTVFLPNATSLRMGSLGYQSDAQALLAVTYNSLASYVRSLHGAVSKPHPPYDAIGLHDGERYQQLATSLLQIENEFYETIRPKRRVRPGERVLHALARRGVEYVEVRCIDVDPFCAIGISSATVRLLDVLLLHCLLADSPPDSREEIATIARNLRRVAEHGRDPSARLIRGAEELGLAEWGTELLRGCEPIAAALDDAHGGSAYRDVLAAALAALPDPSQTPSAKALRRMEEAFDHSFVRFSLAQSLRHRQELLAHPFTPETEARYRRASEDSIAAARRMQAADRVPFEVYRQRYLERPLASPVRL